VSTLARNILIRALFTGAKVAPLDNERYLQLLAQWQIQPYLARLLQDELKAAAQIG
jgi:hypothetical protein